MHPSFPWRALFSHTHTHTSKGEIDFPAKVIIPAGTPGEGGRGGEGDCLTVTFLLKGDIWVRGEGIKVDAEWWCLARFPPV
jgi:hypothetical protein